MTVKELIEELKKYPQDTIVLTQNSSATFTDNVQVGFSDSYPRYGGNVVFIESAY